MFCTVLCYAHLWYPHLAFGLLTLDKEVLKDASLYGVKKKMVTHAHKTAPVGSVAINGCPVCLDLGLSACIEDMPMHMARLGDQGALHAPNLNKVPRNHCNRHWSHGSMQSFRKMIGQMERGKWKRNRCCLLLTGIDLSQTSYGSMGRPSASIRNSMTFVSVLP